MRRILASSTLAVAALTASLVTWSATPANAQRTQDQLRQIGAKLAAELALACPSAPNRNEPAVFQKCAEILAQSTQLPFASMVLWGGDQADKTIKNRHLTRFSGEVFRSTYMPFMTFTGKFTIDRDEREKMDIIRVEGYFRNALPAGDYPYPFWHADAKWDAYEKMNRMSFYLNDQGKIAVITRGVGEGMDANRGAYGLVKHAPFVKDQWTWTDSSGQLQPRIMLFSTLYQPANPQLVKLEDSYRTFANTMREAACIACHVPNNPPGARQLILLQTPLHAAGEIDRVIRSVQGGSMPLDDVGLPKDLDAKLKEEILRTAQAFRADLDAANKWEASRRQAVGSTDLPAQPSR